MLDLDPFITTLVATLAKRIGDGVADAAHGAWSALVRMVRRRLSADPKAAETLAAVEQAPGDAGRQAALAAALRQAVADDPGFGEQLRSLWQQAQVEIQITGTAQHLFQAGQQLTVNYLASPEQPRATPHQVPAAAATFVNRATELSSVDEAVVRSVSTGTAICMLVGMPGVGKTTTACQWNALNRGRFPGGEIYVDFSPLHRHTGAGAAMSEAVASCLRGLGVQEPFIPVELTDQVNRCTSSATSWCGG